MFHMVQNVEGNIHMVRRETKAIKKTPTELRKMKKIVSEMKDTLGGTS